MTCWPLTGRLSSDLCTTVLLGLAGIGHGGKKSNTQWRKVKHTVEKSQTHSGEKLNTQWKKVKHTVEKS